MNTHNSILKAITAFFLLFIFAQASQAQTCPTGLLHLNSQVDVDSFPIKYPGCTSLPNGILIGIYPSSNDVTNLDALSQITSIGDFSIYNSALTNCEMPNLTSVNDLILYGNVNLVSLSGLSQLTTITGDVSIESNVYLEDFFGLANLNSIAGNLEIKSNTFLTDLGMPKLNSVSGTLTIVNNISLGILELPQLTTVGDISITSNLNLSHIKFPVLNTVGLLSMNSLLALQTLSFPQLNTVGQLNIGGTGLNNFNGFLNLNTVSGEFRIRDNDNLVNLSGLSNLNSISGEFIVSDNDNLINFAGLNNLTTVTSRLRVLRNLKLQNLVGLENLSSTGGLLIGDNLDGNNNLTSLQGLSGLVSAGMFYIRDNPKLTNLNALTSLNSVASILLWNNDQLTDISKLASVNANELSYVTIKNNANLSICNIDPVCAYLQVPGSNVGIANNKVGCASVEQVILACNPSSNILVTCPESFSIAIPSGASTVAANWTEPTTATNCSTSSTVNLTSNISSGTALGLGAHTVTYTATDNCSNSATCSFMITVGSSPAAFNINITNCPSAYPNSGDDYILDFTVTNTGGLPSEAQNLQLVQYYWQVGNLEHTIVGVVSIPSISPGQTYTGSHNFGSVGSFPSDFPLATWSISYSNAYTLRTNYGPGEQNYEATLNLFCKKNNAELSVQVAANSYQIDADGNLEYDITVSNTSSERAANIMTHVAPTLWNKNQVTLSNTPATSHAWKDKSEKEDLFLHISLLEAGASETFHVSVHIQGEIPEIFEPNVYTYSHHQLNEQVYYDITQAQFSQSTGGGSCTDISGYTKLGDYNGHGYYMSNDNKPWAQAKTLSENAGGYLAAMNTQGENDFVKSKLANNLVYIGFNDVASEGSTQWANGDPVTLDLSYANTSANDFAVMNFWAGTWQMEQAGPWRKYIMEKSCGSGPTGDLTITCPDNVSIEVPAGQTTGIPAWSPVLASTTCSNGSTTTLILTNGLPLGSAFPLGVTTVTFDATDLCNNIASCSFAVTVSNANSGGSCDANIAGYTKLGEHNGHGYYMSNDNKPWTQAKTLAENAGGYLATMNDQAENDFLKSNLANNLVYIGFNDVTIEGSGQWANGEAVSLDLSYANTGTNDYAVMNFWAGTWQMEQAGPWRKYIMEMSCGGTNNNLPDLTVDNITNFPSQAAIGTQVDFNFNLNNAGNATATGNYVVGMYLSTDAVYSSDDILVGQVPTGGTPVGTIADIPAAIAIPGNIAGGNYYLVIVADINNTIAEANESNNENSISLLIGTGATGCASVAGFTKLGEYNGHGYYMSTVSSNWNNAKTLSENAGGYLATMNDQAENDFLKSKLGSSMVFIGYNDATTEGTGSWATTEAVSLDLSYGNSANNDYAIMNFWAGTWQMVNQYVVKPYVMEKSCAVAQPASIQINTVSALNIQSSYPNPANDNITLRVLSQKEKEVTFNIYDGRGQLYLTENRFLQEGVSEVEFEINELPAGMYFVKEAGAVQYYNFVILR